MTVSKWKLLAVVGLGLFGSAGLYLSPAGEKPAPNFADRAVAVFAPLPKIATIPINAANANAVVKLLEIDKRVHRIHPGPAKGELIFLDRSLGVEIVDDLTLKAKKTLLEKDKPDDYVVSPDGKRFTWSKQNSKIYTVGTKDNPKAYEITSNDHIGYAAFSPDSTILAVGDVFWSPDAEGVGESHMKLYDAATGKLLRTLEKGGPGALRPVFSPDGKLLAVSNRNYEPRVHDVATGKLLFSVDKRMTQEVAFSPDGKLLACGFVDGSVGIWSVPDGKQLHLVKTSAHEIYSVAWSAKGDVLASSGREGNVILWNPKTMDELKAWNAGFWVIQVRFSADGARLYTSSAEDYGANGRKVTMWGVGEK